MEPFMQELGERLQREYEGVHQGLEGDLKRMYHVSFSKVAECFGRPGSLQDASECSNHAREPVERFNHEMGNLMGGLENNFKQCLTGCGLARDAKLTDTMRKCMNGCADTSIADLKNSQARIDQIVRNHS